MPKKAANYHQKVGTQNFNGNPEFPGTNPFTGEGPLFGPHFGLTIGAHFLGEKHFTDNSLS